MWTLHLVITFVCARIKNKLFGAQNTQNRWLNYRIGLASSEKFHDFTTRRIDEWLLVCALIAWWSLPFAAVALPRPIFENSLKDLWNFFSFQKLSSSSYNYSENEHNNLRLVRIVKFLFDIFISSIRYIRTICTYELYTTV